MGGSTRPRLRSEISRGSLIDDPSEGTSARTRPLSYEEIMLNRKSKKEPDGFVEKVREGENLRREESNRNLDHRSRDAKPVAMKNSRDHVREASSRNKEEKTSRGEDTYTKSKSKESHGLDSRSKHRHEKSVRNSTEGFKTDRREHAIGILDEKSHDPDSRSKHKHEKDGKNRSEGFKTDRQEHLGGIVDEKSHDTYSRIKQSSEKDVKNSSEAFKTDRREHVRGKLDEKHHDLHSKSMHKHEKDMKNSSEVLKADRREHVSERLGEKSLDNRSKHKHEKDVNNSTEALKADKRGHLRGKQDEVGHDMYGISKHKHEKEERNIVENDRRGHVRSKLDDHVRDNGRYEYEKKYHKDSLAQDRHIERSGASERENKRKDRSGDDEKYRIRDPVKKHDSGSRRDSEIAERKEKMESLHPRHDEVRSKRRRSRSQDRTKDKGQKPSSPSPKAHKNVSSREHEHGDSQRDRSRHHSDADRNKISNNGTTSHHRRHAGSSSGLGGYSPRKRKSEAAAKTPSPIRSPEIKSAGWDLPPSGGDKSLSTSIAPDPQLVSQTKSSNMIELAAGLSVASSMVKPLSAILSHSLSAFKEASLDSVQLTQATRPMRRLYVDNIPGSASEKELMEFFNTLLLSSGSNHIRGTCPCISCMIHKEKGQALVEFLTPEDASTALMFDGRSFAGSNLTIRRPKDFVDVTSGFSERLKAGAEAVRAVAVRDVVKDVSISDVVKDSPHKIFIGGIAEGLSSEMVMEIVSAFGPLKAYHFEINGDINEPCAFLEYADESVTSKACAGLNGMKFGGRVLTVAQAVPDTTTLENTKCRPFYGIPEHVKPLLETPTQVLKLSNVFDQKALELLSETDLEEIMEDVRLECSRFGSVISANVVKTSNVLAIISETKEVTDVTKPLEPFEESEIHDHQSNEKLVGSAMDHDEGEDTEGRPNIKEFFEVDGVQEGDKLDFPPVSTDPRVEVKGVGTSIVEEAKDAGKNVLREYDDNATDDVQESVVNYDSTTEDTQKPNNSNANNQETIVEGGVSSEMEPNGNTGIEMSVDDESPDAQELDNTNDKLPEVVSVSNESATTNLGATDGDMKNGNLFHIGDVFEVGSVLVEFRRTEASCLAAHCLHGRAFDDRIVAVEYVPLEAYRAKFQK